MTKKLTPEAAQAVQASPPPYMNLAQAAAYLGISPRKLWGEAAKRQVKAARIGARLVFPRAELDRYVALKVAAA